MFKNKPLIIAIVVVIVMGCISFLYFDKPVAIQEQYNLIIINNTGEKIKSIGYYYDNESGGMINADNSLIKEGDKMYLNVTSRKFKLSVTDKNGRQTISPELTLNLDNNKKYEVYIEKNKDSKFIFEMK
ncbi:hypothetical protein [Intestinibacter sp.]